MANKSYNVKTQYGAESTYGTTASSFTNLGRVQSFEPNLNNNLIRIRGTGGGRNADFVFGNLDIEASITTQLIDFDLLKHFIGPISGSGTSGDPYIITEADSYGTGASDIRVFTLKVNSDESTDDCDAYQGCVGTDFSITFEVGQPIIIESNVRAQDVDSTASMSGFTESTDEPFMVYQGTYKFGTTPSAVADVRRLRIQTNNNPQIFRSLSSRRISKPETGVRDYDFEMDVVMTTTVETEFRDVMYGASGAPASDSTANPATNIELSVELAGADNRNAVIHLDGVVINSISKPVNVGGDVIVLRVRGHAKQAKDNNLLRWWTA